METVHVKWYGMYSINDFIIGKKLLRKGIFALSELYAKNVTLLYIETNQKKLYTKR